MSSAVVKASRIKVRFEPVDFVLPLICLVLYGAWAAVLPIEIAPDEPMRLAIPCFMLEHGHLPFGNEPQILSDMWGSSYVLVPYGSSLLAFPFVKIATMLSSSKALLVWTARLGSILPAVGTVLICERIGKRLFERPLSPYLLAALCGLLPQAVFLSSYLNNESIMVFATALIIDAWLQGADNGWDVGDRVYLGVSLGICALSYYFAYGYILASVVVFFVSSHKKVREGAISRRTVFLGALTIFFIAFAVGGWFFIRNAMLHDGDIFGMRTSREIAEVMALDSFKPSNHPTPARDGISLLNMIFSSYHNHIWWRLTSVSAIGLFGYLNIFLPFVLYGAYALLFLVGLILGFVNIAKGAGGRRPFFLLFLILIAFSIGMSIYFSYAIDYEPQGRYLASALVPTMIVITGGYDWLSARLLARTTAGDEKAKREKDGGAKTLKSVVASKIPTIVLAVYLLLFVCSAITTMVPRCTYGIMSGSGYHGLLEPNAYLQW